MQFLLARGTATEFIPLSEDYLKNSLQNWLSICCCWNLHNSQKLKMKVESFWLHHQIVPLNFFTSLVTLFQLGKFQRHWLLTIQLTAFNPKPQSVCAITLSCPCDMIMCNCWHPGFSRFELRHVEFGKATFTDCNWFFLFMKENVIVNVWNCKALWKD